MQLRMVIYTNGEEKQMATSAELQLQQQHFQVQMYQEMLILLQLVVVIMIGEAHKMIIYGRV